MALLIRRQARNCFVKYYKRCSPSLGWEAWPAGLGPAPYADAFLVQVISLSDRNVFCTLHRSTLICVF